jgi:formylglycine-generating enzyme required for sulfatase activity
MGFRVLLLGLIVALAPLTTAQTRHLTVSDREGNPVVQYEGSYALVIGVESYTENSGWPVLQGVPEDVEAVSSALRHHGFEVETLMDPDHTELKSGLESFINRRGLVAGHRLLIYFAGHGHTLRQSYGEQMGYLVPADAPHPSLDRGRFLTRAVSMAEIQVLALKIQARHALFLFDSCFAGTIFTLERTGEAPASIRDRMAEPVRVFITAGKANETVPDRSVFRHQLVAALEGEGDLYEDGYVTGMELGEFLYNKVTNYTRGKQHPQYGKIRHPGLDKGDFVFRLPAPEVDAAPTPRPPSGGEFSLEDLTERADEIERRQKEWAGWQGQMQKAFDEVTAYADRPVTAELKAEAWQRFLDAYPEDNPFGSDDESLRARAGEELRRLRAAAAPSVRASGTDGPATAAQAGDRKIETLGGAELALRYIPAGEFRMGSPEDEEGRDDDETPHQVTLTRPFWMLETEVTQGQWQQVMGTTPSYFSSCGTDCPVERVSWYDAVAFANELSELGGLGECYRMSCSGKAGVDLTCSEVRLTGLDCTGWRLPTEAEWEYAARAETESAIYTGKLTIRGIHNGPELDTIAWYGGNSGVDYEGGWDCSNWPEKQYPNQGSCGLHPVGQKQATAWGLHDMLGNVWEWVWDWFRDYPSNAVTDPNGSTHGSSRVSRGGGWSSFARSCRSALRGARGPVDRYSDLGFRVVRTASE